MKLVSYTIGLKSVSDVFVYQSTSVFITFDITYGHNDSVESVFNSSIHNVIFFFNYNYDLINYLHLQDCGWLTLQLLSFSWKLSRSHNEA